MNPDLVIGIDPGSRKTGWGIVAERSGMLELVDCGVIRTETRERMDRLAMGASGFALRLAKIFQSLTVILKRYEPGAAAVEQIFTAKNMASALKLGQARGAAIAACAGQELEIFDYEPTMVKRSLVGTGRAEKEQVSFMVGKLLNIHTKDWVLDTTDALAVAICHMTQRRYAKLASLAVH